MKVKIKYEIANADGDVRKTYTKTFSQVNQEASDENIKTFASAYLDLLSNNGHPLNYAIYKADDKLIEEGKLS
ncbi:hypothetical protein [uncultured Anaerococcus sp.]|uniref:DUF1659 domain-containing protein n=1 Tax=uncultured Anaerococcus sp. TaxID=293428 RepID=UPI0025FE784F|nr:hypothetical protein [uncultured Anaerococcus sp.]